MKTDEIMNMLDECLGDELPPRAEHQVDDRKGSCRTEKCRSKSCKEGSCSR